MVNLESGIDLDFHILILTKHAGEFCARIFGTHKGFADQEAVDAVALHQFDVIRIHDAALGNDNSTAPSPALPLAGGGGWNDARQQIQRVLQTDLEGAQVAVVHADQGRRQLQRGIEFLAIVHFYQNCHSK